METISRDSSWKNDFQVTCVCFVAGAFDTLASLFAQVDTAMFRADEAKVCVWSKFQMTKRSRLLKFRSRLLIFLIQAGCVLLLQRHLIGLARDLRGVAFAFNTKVSYMMLFDWMYPFSKANLMSVKGEVLSLSKNERRKRKPSTVHVFGPRVAESRLT